MSIEKPGVKQETAVGVERTSEEYLMDQARSLKDKIVNVLKILLPHDFDDMIYKLSGTMGIIAGIDILNAATNLRPEQLISPSDPMLIATEAICSALIGSSLFAAGIMESIKRVKKNEGGGKSFSAKEAG